MAPKTTSRKRRQVGLTEEEEIARDLFVVLNDTSILDDSFDEISSDDALDRSVPYDETDDDVEDHDEIFDEDDLEDEDYEDYPDGIDDEDENEDCYDEPTEDDDL